jgi:integrase
LPANLANSKEIMPILLYKRAGTRTKGVIVNNGSRIKFLDPGEVHSLLEQPSLRSLTGLRNRCVMGLMYQVGLRTGEVLSLKPRDVVLEEKRVEVLRGKGHKSRTVYFRSDELVMLLERWKRERPRGEYLFPTVRSTAGKGDKIDGRGFRITFKRYVERAGLDPQAVTLRVLRHTCATEMMRRGGEPAGDPGGTRAQLGLHHTDLHPRGQRRHPAGHELLTDTGTVAV